MNESFLYCWTDWKTNMVYVGKHKGLPSDGYVCSSKKMLSEYNRRPHDFTREIIAEGTDASISKLEAVVLRSAQAHLDESYYNQALANGVCFATPEIRKAMSVAAKNRISNRKNVVLSEETKRLISKNNKSSKSIKTPYGDFSSRAEFSKYIGVSQQSIKEFFKRLDKPLSTRGVKRLYKMEDAGKTPRELGYA